MWTSGNVEMLGLAAVVEEQPDCETDEDFPIPERKENLGDVHVSDSLSPDQTRDLKQLMEEFPSIFSSTPGQTSLLSHAIEVTSSSPVRCKPYPIPLAKLGVVKQEVEKMREMGVIEPSHSPYSSPLLLIRKSDSTYRPVVDFRQLNKVTKFDAEPMPNPDTILAEVGQNRYWSKLDFCKGYWQIRMELEDKEKTAFCTPQGLFQFPYADISRPVLGGKQGL